MILIFSYFKVIGDFLNEILNFIKIKFNLTVLITVSFQSFNLKKFMLIFTYIVTLSYCSYFLIITKNIYDERQI